MKDPELQVLMNMPLEHSVAELLARSFDADKTHEDRVSRLGAAAAPIIREALPISDKFRGRTDIDPADAFIEGVTFSELNRQELFERTQFAAEMDMHIEVAAAKPRGRLRAWLLGSAALFFAGGKVIKANWAEDDGHLAQ